MPCNDNGLICHEECSCANNSELINEKVRNWEKIKTQGWYEFRDNE